MKEYKIKVNGNDYNITVDKTEGNTAEMTVNGQSYTVELDKPMVEAPQISRPVAQVSKPAAVSNTGGGGSVKSPLPGVIVDVCVKDGDQVKTGQKLFVLEAMKMENAINADRDGKVTSIKVNKGDSVMEGDDLLTIA